MLRRCRSHHYGFTNIDLRSKQDEKALSLYQPWRVPKDFGTMGRSNYTLPPEEYKKIFKVSSSINKMKQMNSGCPDPKTYGTCLYYEENKIPINEKANLESERVAQLDESMKGKEVFIGDSMMISDLVKIRKANKSKKTVDKKDKKNKMKINEGIIKEKAKQNKESVHETQLVSIKAEKTLEGKVDIKKLKEIRLVLRRKYGNKTNFRKIFKDWNMSVNGEITVYDAHKMINSFGIPINFNETRALIASSNQRGTETLDLQEFMHLIFSDNPALNVDLSKLKYKDERLYSEGEQVEAFEKKMKISVAEKSKKDNISFLEEYLRLKIPKLLRLVKEKGAKEDFVDYDTYLDVMKQFSIPEHYYTNSIMKGLFDKYAVKKEENEGMNVKQFAETLIKNSLDNSHNFYQFKATYLDTLQKKLVRSKSEVYSNRKMLEEHRKEQKKILSDYTEQIEEKKKRLNRSQIINEVNSSQPSTEFIKKIFCNRDEYNKRLDEIEKSFTAFPSLKLEGKTRSGANPKAKNTFPEFQADSSSGMYISERERFKVRSLNDKIDFIHNDKLNKMSMMNGRIERIINNNNKIEKYIRTIDLKKTYHESLSQASKTKMLYEYELKNKIRNEIIE